MVVPSLERLSKEGEVGQQKITQYTRYLTVGLAFAQSIGYVLLFNSQSFGSSDIIEGQLTFGTALLIALSLTAGATLLMWMGELITQRGIVTASAADLLDRRRPAGRYLMWWTNPDQCSS